MKGQTLSHYRVLEMVGQGASGIIYKAEDLALGRLVALKCLPPDLPGSGSTLLRFQHEARTASGINHPNICTIHEIGDHEGQQFIVMEWLEGRTLGQLIDNRPMKLETLLEYSIQAADGLHAAHAEGIVHRDVKPENILITAKGQAKILDFGIALLTSPSAQFGPASSHPVGTAPYMSPEQVHGEDLDARSDLFSLGVVLYEMTTGRRPFIAGTIQDTLRLIAEHSPDPPQSLNPYIPDELNRIVMKALEKNRKLRFQTAADLTVDLLRLKRDFDSGILRAAPRSAHLSRRVTDQMQRPVTGRAALYAIAASLIAVLVVLTNREVSVDDAEPSAMLPIREAPSHARDSAIHLEMKAESVAQSRTNSEALPRGRTTSAASPAASIVVEPSVSPVPTMSTDTSMERELGIVRKQVDAGLHVQAVETLRPLLTRYSGEPGAVDAYLLMGAIQEAQGKHEDAMATYVEAADRFKGNQKAAQALYRFADVSLKSKHADRDAKAREALRQLAATYPDSEWAPSALLFKADIEERKGLREPDPELGASVPSALITYRHLTATYPEAKGGAVARRKLAELYEEVKRYDLAARAFVELATRHPQASSDAWYRAAELYRRRLKDPQMARHAYANVPKDSRYFNEAQGRLR